MSCFVSQLISYQIFSPSLYSISNLDIMYCVDTYHPCTAIIEEVLWEEERVDLGVPVNWSAVKLGDVVTVPMSHSGLTDLPTLQLYIRQASLDLFKFLHESTKNVQMVYGCPGVGKSDQIFSCAMWQAQTHNKRVLYIHGDDVNGYSILFKDDPFLATARVCLVQELVAEPQVLRQFIQQVLYEDGVDLIVLDGALPWLNRKVYYEMKKYPQVVLITCTSFQPLGKISHEAYFKSAPYAHFIMDSWSETEYEDAVDKGALVLPPGITVSEMYFYAGGSIRIFQKPVEEVITYLEMRMDGVSCSDMGKRLGISGAFGDDASAIALNSLMSVYDGRSIVLSQFVIRKLLESSVTNDFIQKARLILPDNVAWQGWITEAEVMQMARTRRNLAFRDNPYNSTSVDIWCAEPGVITFVNDQDKVLQSQKIGWYQSMKWNEKGIDALFRVSNHELKVVQMTNSPCRNFDLSAVIPIVKAMNVQVVVIVHVCREQNFKTFQMIETGGEESRKALEDTLQRIYEVKIDKARKAKKEKSMGSRTIDDQVEGCSKPKIAFQKYSML